ncbi:MAG: DUF126 domain-containing protein [Pseudomonadota bacterium]
MSLAFQGDVLVKGVANGEVLYLQEPLSFWGGFNPDNGEIIDTHHPQFQQVVTDKILIIVSSRGSAGTPGGIAETLRNGSGPAAFVLVERDVNIGVGVLVANRLYQMEVPVIAIGQNQLCQFSSGQQVSIDASGELRISEPV